MITGQTLETPSWSVVIPAWNEERTIAHAAREMVRACEACGVSAEVLVIDDGSTDKTAERAEALVGEGIPVRVIRHARNMGKGAAVRTGVQAATGEWILMTDADLSVSPDQLSRFLPACSRADMLIGSRRIAGAEIPEPQPWMRDVAGRLYNLIARAVLSMPYRDTQCGFKAFHARTKSVFVDLQTDGWAFDTEVLVRARMAGHAIEEIPVTWRHGRETRVRWSAWKRIISDLWRIRNAARNRSTSSASPY